MSGNVARPSPDILTYRHGSRMVYVTPAETFEACLQFFFWHDSGIAYWFINPASPRLCSGGFSGAQKRRP
jgi:hypothetical protein